MSKETNVQLVQNNTNYLMHFKIEGYMEDIKKNNYLSDGLNENLIEIETLIFCSNTQTKEN